MFKKIFSAIFLIGVLLIFFPSRVSAQMMWGYPSSSPSPVSSADIQTEEQEQQEGQAIFNKLQNKQISCQQLTSSDFAKIGDYFMGISIGDTARHVQVDNNLKQMMGEQGDEQFHIALGEQKSGCGNSGGFANYMMGGGAPFMMGWGGYGFNNMMGGYGFGVLAGIFWVIALADLILLGVWLLKVIRKK